nr:hypothetical protein Iba_chr03cCG1660 [Ipomoea batatas]GMC77727.1 hypothetical protein Iba_chr03fCG1280 [Ipomoea batatas]GME10229.1 hypothetical protein Iba_scaffold9750CG0040 [Ipomoea batatas]
MKGESKRRALSLPSRPLRFRFSPESSSSPISAYSGGGSSGTASVGGFERLGEVEKRTEDDGETDRRRFTRVGDVGRVSKLPDRVANLDDGDDIDDEQNRSDGDIER